MVLTLTWTVPVIAAVSVFSLLQSAFNELGVLYETHRQISSSMEKTANCKCTFMYVDQERKDAYQFNTSYLHYLHY